MSSLNVQYDKWPIIFSLLCVVCFCLPASAQRGHWQTYGMIGGLLCEVVSHNWSKSAEAIKGTVVAGVFSHISEAEIYDDITIVILKQI